MPADRDEVNFLYGNNLPKDLDQLQASQPITGPCEGLHSSKLNSGN